MSGRLSRQIEENQSTKVSTLDGFLLMSQPRTITIDFTVLKHNIYVIKLQMFSPFVLTSL